MSMRHEPLHKQQGPFHPLREAYVPVTPGVWAIEENSSVGVGEGGHFWRRQECFNPRRRRRSGQFPPDFRRSESFPHHLGPSAEDLWSFLLYRALDIHVTYSDPQNTPIRKSGHRAPSVYKHGSRDLERWSGSQFPSADVSECRQDPRAPSSRACSDKKMTLLRKPLPSLHPSYIKPNFPYASPRPKSSSPPRGRRWD